MCLWALGVFKLQPGQVWLNAWQASAIKRLDVFAAPDLAYSLQGFSVLGESAINKQLATED